MRKINNKRLYGKYKGIIYLIKNKINNKCYVGQTLYTFYDRYHGNWSKSTSNPILKQEVMKYGKNSFDIYILEDNIKTLKELNRLEEFHANQLNSYYPNGYNLDACGQNKQLSEYTKNKLATFRSGNYIPKNKTSSKYMGVSYDPIHKKYECGFYNRKIKRKQYCETELDAAIKRDKIALYLFGNKIQLNFPELLNEYLKNDLEAEWKSFLAPKDKAFKRNSYKLPSKEHLEKMYECMFIADMAKLLNMDKRQLNLRMIQMGIKVCRPKRDLKSLKRKKSFYKKYNYKYGKVLRDMYGRNTR